MKRLDTGFIQVYTGNGKGKTTAAIGQAVRAAGMGYKTLIIQFMKEYPYNELKSLEYLKEWITLEQYCGDDFVYKGELPPQNETDKAHNALRSAAERMENGEYDIIILDEAIVSIYFRLLPLETVIDFMNKKPAAVELILTGRYCPPEIIEKADLVTEMLEVKHYYEKGVPSRKGIES